MARNLFKAAQLDIRNFKRAANADTMGDYKASGSQLDAIFANLRTTGAGLSRSLTQTQGRELSAMDRIRARNVAASSRVVKTAAAGEVNAYGSAMGGEVQRTLAPARATSSATRVATEGQLKGGTMLSNAGKAAMASETTAATEAQGSANYAHEVALKARFQTDAATVAQMKFDLQSKRIDHQFAMQEMQKQAALQWKYRELELNKLQDAQQNDPAIYTGMTQAASSAAGAYTSLQSLFNQPMMGGADGTTPLTNADGTPRYMNATEAAAAYVASSGATDPAEVSFINSIARAMYSGGAGPTNPGQLYGAGTSDALRQQMVVDSIMETFIAQYPQYAGKADSLRAYLESTGAANYTIAAAGLLQQAAAGAGGTISPDYAPGGRFAGVPAGPEHSSTHLSGLYGVQ